MTTWISSRGNRENARSEEWKKRRVTGGREGKKEKKESVEGVGEGVARKSDERGSCELPHGALTDIIGRGKFGA